MKKPVGNQTKLSFVAEQSKNESISLGLIRSCKSAGSKADCPKILCSFRNAARHATNTGSLSFLSHLLLHNSTNLGIPIIEWKQNKTKDKLIITHARSITDKSMKKHLFNSNNHKLLLYAKKMCNRRVK